MEALRRVLWRHQGGSCGGVKEGPRRILWNHQGGSCGGIERSCERAKEHLVAASRVPSANQGRHYRQSDSSGTGTHWQGLENGSSAPSANQRRTLKALKEKIRAAIRTALMEGCGKHRNVFIIGPPNAAKTHLLAPLVAIFGPDSFRRPLGKTNYPMMDIHGKKVCVLEDLRSATFGLGWDAYLVWWEGLPLPTPMPQNHHKGPKEYVDRAPVFATGGDRLRIPLREALELGVDPSVQNEMMDKRWVYFHFTHSFDGSNRESVPPWAHCFAKWVQHSELAIIDFF